MSKAEPSLSDKILNASRTLLVTHGYQKLSMRKIAQEIGVSATSIYIHFKNKDHLLHTLMEHSIESLSKAIEKPDIENLTAAEKVEAIAKAYVNFATANPEEYQVIYLVKSHEMERYPKEKFRKVRRGYDLLAHVIEDAVKSGAIEESNPLLAAYTIWAQLHGVVSVVINNRLDFRISREDFLNSAIEHILQGYFIRTSLS